MATVVLGALGAAIPGVGFITGPLLAAAGAAIDQAFLFPALFPPPNIKGPRLKSLTFTGANEGEPMAWSLGPRNRVTGTVIWMDELEERENRRRQGKGGTGTVSTFQYFQSLAIDFGEANPQTVRAIRRVMGNVKTVYSDGERSKYDAIRLYTGDQTAPDPLMEAKLGAGNVPVFKKRVYVVIERLFLGDFANAPPSWAGFVEQSGDMSVAEAIAAILERSGLFTVDEYDVTRIPYCLRGITFEGIVSTRQELEAVLSTYAVVLQEVDDRLVFFPKGSEIAIDVPASDLLDGSQSGVLWSEDFQVSVPEEATVSYVSDDVDLQPGAKRFRDRSRGGTRQHQITFDTPATLSGEEAHELAKRLVAEAIVEQQKVEFSLPPAYAHIAAGDAIRMTLDGVQHYIIAQGVDFGASGEVKISGNVSWPDIFSQSGVGSPFNFEGDSGYIPPELDSFVADLPALTDLETREVVVRWGTRTRVEGVKFAGAVLFASAVGITYVDVSEINQQASMGRVRVGPGQGTILTWDHSNEIEVELRGNLSSSTEAEVLNGEDNIAALQTRDGEWEILGFVTATLVSAEPRRYRLTQLLRGLRGTERLVGEHPVSGGRFVLLSGGTSRLGRWYVNASRSQGSTPFIKVVPEGEMVQDVSADQVAIRGRTMTPFAPWGMRWILRTNGVGDQDIEIFWARRSKKFFDSFVAATPLSEDESGEFLVELRLGGYLSPLLRSFRTRSEGFLYTQAMRDADAASNPHGWGSEDGFRVHVRQLSTIIGEGHRSELGVIR